MSNDLMIKKPDEMVKMRGEFSESALKLSAYLISILEKDKRIYSINVKDYLSEFDKKIGDFDYLYQVAQELTRKQFRMFDRFNKRFGVYNFVASVEYNKGVLEIEFSSMLMKYLLQIKEKYTKYYIKNIMNLNSKYAVRIYEILKNTLEESKRYDNQAILEVNLEEFKEFLSIPKGYRFNNIKTRIINVAQKEINKKTDIYFKWESKKLGRKVGYIKFFVSEKVKKTQSAKPQINFNTWRMDLLSQTRGEGIIRIGNEVYNLKGGYLWQNDKLLTKERALSAWRKLYENRDKIKIINQEELQKEIQKRKFQRLKSLIGRKTSIVPEGQKDFVFVEIINIEPKSRDLKSVLITFRDIDFPDKVYTELYIPEQIEMLEQQLFQVLECDFVNYSSPTEKDLGWSEVKKSKKSENKKLYFCIFLFYKYFYSYDVN